MLANCLVLFTSTPNNDQIYKTTKNLKFQIVKSTEKQYCSASEFRHPVNFVTCHLNPQKPAILVLKNMQPQLVILLCNSAMEIKCKYGLILS